MKLKKLEISGFKSFLEKTCIQFPQGISAVVGPNGCGKSNVVDALKWVMGEQSVKQLRGKSMEDVIFSGAAGKPPLNMAEVTLTILNDNGSAPEELRDFSEIMLTRRLYRSGESAYLLNKQPCRLKDIHNLFLGSGMGAKSFAIIQQGNIGAITEAGPEERKYYIEEAAGVTRFKNRKNEALRKISSTNQNLLRLSDIISEINRQMAGLKRQARKAELYNNYLNRIRKLDIHLGIQYYNEYTKKIDETGTLLKAIQDEDHERISKLKKIDAAIEEIKLERWQKNQRISSRKSRKIETQRDIDKKENDLAYLRKDMVRLGNETTELENAHKDLEEKNQKIVQETGMVEKECGETKEKIKKLSFEIENEQLASKNIKDEYAQLNNRLDTCKKNLMDLVAREARYKNIRQNALNNKENLKRRLKKIDEEEVLANRKVADSRNKVDTSKNRAREIQQEKDALDVRIQAHANQLDEKSKSLGRQVKLVQTVEYEQNKTKSKYAALKKMEENFEWYKDGVRAIMKRNINRSEPSSDMAGPGRQAHSRVKALMADIIEPEPSYETAVEAALGEALQYIVVDDEKECIDSIDYLRAEKAGRSGFIPIATLKQLECKALPEQDRLSLLLNHLSVKNGYGKIVEALLGHVVVANNMEQAAAIHKNNGSMMTIVTKAGDVIFPQGVIVGGSNDKNTGILSKKQELKSLESRIKKMDEELEAARNIQTKLEENVRADEIDLQKLIEQKNKTIQQEIATEKDLYKAKEDLKNAEHHLDIVQLEQDQLMGEENDIAREMEKYDRTVAEIGKKVKSGQEDVTQITGNIDSVSSQIEDFDNRIVNLKLELTALNAGLENNTNTLRRLKEFHGDGLKQIENLEQEINLKIRKKAESKQKKIEHEQALSKLYEGIKSLEQTLEKDEADYQALESRIQGNDSIISKIKSDQEKALQKIRVLELEQAEQKLKRENLETRLKENYRKSLKELKNEIRENPIKLEMTLDEMKKQLALFKQKIENIHDVNLGAIKEYEQFKERFDFLCSQRDDLEKAIEDLHKVIKKINRITQDRFLKTFNKVNEKIQEVFPRLFDGGLARLVLTDPENPLETGVEFMVQPPGKKISRMSLLSGGEKALSAIAFVFSIFLIKPASFCIMDEIDAPLDDVNVHRFNNLLEIIGEKSQVIMITHNKKSMEFAETLFGITMEQKGVSRIVSVNLEHGAALN